jgi:hypothetical protein
MNHMVVCIAVTSVCTLRNSGDRNRAPPFSTRPLKDADLAKVVTKSRALAAEWLIHGVSDNSGFAIAQVRARQPWQSGCGAASI